ncbi:MAG: hypothetical protein M3Y24_12740 [Acidobacteriota bacterium]|nr:hypothetical protein [Acidobacteriota bacterium]
MILFCSGAAYLSHPVGRKVALARNSLVSRSGYPSFADVAPGNTLVENWQGTRGETQIDPSLSVS